MKQQERLFLTPNGSRLLRPPLLQSVVALLLFAAPGVFGAENSTAQFPISPKDCEGRELWDFSMGICLPVADPDISTTHYLIQGNAFATGIAQSGPRGRDGFALPHMLMGYGAKSYGSHLVSVGLMLTFEKWTFPDRGYPQLLQAAEYDAEGRPYIDAQHPHTSPIEGITVSDTIRLGSEGSTLRVFFSPRGESTDGPITFMHRPTGLVNPDSPLGHHNGQDVGHITSTVIGVALKMGSLQGELSVFNGEMPEPDKVNLRMGKPNSGAFRLSYELSERFLALASITKLGSAGHGAVAAHGSHDMRQSVSLYSDHDLFTEWRIHQTLIYGATSLSSFTYEYRLNRDKKNIWGRAEVLQRTSADLGLESQDPENGKWISSFTAGYSHRVAQLGSASVQLGGSVTKLFLPKDFSGAYGGDPWAGKVFLQVGGAKAFEVAGVQ